ncbi:MAG TPA: hypothetical protein VK186_17815 [Candidatus Deferrimicrobium sp.]|nr:hypothetical protein [Candidatus Deferrimicrobium sp.]
MGSQENQTKNLQFCMAKLREFVNTVPKGAGENVNWQELNQHRGLAEMSLTHLASILGGGSNSDNGQIENECFAFPKI